jgi:hypothetical protein
MRGPPPQPAHLKLLRGNPGQRPVKREPEPASLQELPEPPEFLDHDARVSGTESSGSWFTFGS